MQIYSTLVVASMHMSMGTRRERERVPEPHAAEAAPGALLVAGSATASRFPSIASSWGARPCVHCAERETQTSRSGRIGSDPLSGPVRRCRSIDVAACAMR